MKRGWWYSASTEDRLAQIDAAIELGMTSKQCAMNCGCYGEQNYSHSGGNSLVWKFAANHGRHFPQKHSTAAHRKNTGNIVRNGVLLNKRKARIEDAKQAYLSGEPVDIWSVE